MSKYQVLADHLARLPADEWRPTFHEMERLLGFDLPQSAHKSGWWTNEGGGHVTTWSAAGWQVDPDRVDLEGQHVTFRRVRPVAETVADAADGLELADDAGEESERAADRVYAHEGGGRSVERLTSGAAVTAALVGLALGVGVVALRGLLRRRD